MPKGLRARISIKKDCLPMKDSNKEITLRLTDSPGDVARAAELLRAGRLVAIPTETVYGLAADALNGDAESGASKKSAEELYDRFVETVDVQANRGRDIIVLMHDTNSKKATVEMLPDAIDYLKDLGYTIATLESVPMEE